MDERGRHLCWEIMWAEYWHWERSVTEIKNDSDEDDDPAYVPEDDETSYDEVVDEEAGLSDNGESCDEEEVVEEDIELFNHDNYEE